MTTVAVTGARGFLGRRVVAALRESGVAVVPLGRDAHGRVVRLERADSRTLFDGVDAVVHLAARLVDDRSAPLGAYLQPNVALTDDLVREAAATGVPAFVLASSRLVYPSTIGRPAREDDPPAPELPYGVSKWFAEQAVAFAAGARVRHTSLRFSQLIGHGDPDQSVLARFARRAREGAAISISGDGGAVRDFLDVRDAARATVLAVRHLLDDTLPPALNVGGGPIPLRELARVALAAFGRDTAAIQLGAGSHDDSYWALDCSLAAETIRWRPTIDLSVAIRERAEAAGLWPPDPAPPLS